MRALLALLLASSAAAAIPEDGWRATQTPHFTIKHESNWLPPGLTMAAERVHGRLRLDMGMFSPWMAKEKINLYVYANQESFLAGSFKPPAWSNGMALYRLKAVVVPVMKEPRKQFQVLAHETTHLLFDSYWLETSVDPPAWLNEGLAMIQEADAPDKPETTIWYQIMASKEPRRFPGLEPFFAAKPSELGEDQKLVELWYAQAYAVTYYLLRKHSRLQFKSFCEHLRAKKPVAEALWLAYRYRKVSELEAKWRLWLADPAHRRKVEGLSLAARTSEQGAMGRGQHSFKFFSTGYTVGGDARRLNPADDPRKRQQ